MPGFAVTSSIAASEGKAGSAFVRDIGPTPKSLLTAAKKTRVTSLVANNKEGGILPFDLYVRRETSPGVFSNTYIAERVRVFKRKFVVLALVDQDPRVGAEKMDDIPHTEIVLLPGDTLFATTPIASSFDVTVTYAEGIS